MPRKDPVTGCMVMTTAELAAAEGLTVEQYMQPIFDSIDEDERNEKERLSSRKEVKKLLDSIFAPSKGWKVKTVCEVNVHFKLRSSELSVEFEGVSPGGESGMFRVSLSHWDGTRLDPPDESVGIECLSNGNWEEDFDLE